MGAFEEFGRTAREGCDALRVGEDFVDLVGCCTEFLLVGEFGCVDDGVVAVVGCGGCGCGFLGGFVDAGVAVGRGCGEFGRGVFSRGVLDVFAVFCDQGWAELLEV